jgi:hypothetical protein
VSDGTAVDIYEPVIADLDERIAALQAMRDNLESLRSGVSPVALRLGLQTRGTGVTFDNDAFFQMTAGDAAKKFLSAIKKTATINAIGEALIAGGWKTASKNISENLRAILSRHPDFVKINGEFGLAEWYPGRKSVRRQGTADELVLASAVEEAAAMLGDQEERTSIVPVTPSEQ